MDNALDSGPVSPQATLPTNGGVQLIAARRPDWLHIPLTQLGLGSGPLGGFPGAPVDDETAQSTLQTAWQVGVRAFDTAPWYGLGAAEQRLGTFLAGMPRGELVLSTKVGRVLSEPTDRRAPPPTTGWSNALPMEWRFDYRRDGVLRSFEGSRERLGVERVDILLIHDLEPDAHGQSLAARLHELDRGGGFQALRELRASGAIDAIGLGVNQPKAVKPVLDRFDLDVVLLAGSYTLLNTSALDTALPLCLERGVSVIVGGAFNSGILATGAVAGATFDYAVAPAEVLERVRRLGEVCEAYSVELGAAALRFPLAHPAIVSVCVGAASPEEVQIDARLFGRPIPADFWAELQRHDLLRPDAPVLQGSSV